MFYFIMLDAPSQNEPAFCNPLSAPLHRPDQEINSQGRVKLTLLTFAIITESCKFDWLYLRAEVTQWLEYSIVG